MPITSMSQMWTRLNTYTMAASGEERSVNHNNEWGGFSRFLKMPVFTGWRDHLTFNKDDKTTTALVYDKEWSARRPVGSANQERWLEWAEQNNNGVAAFFVIHAVDERAALRKVRYIDDDKVFVGPIVRDQGKVLVVGKPRLI